MTDITMTGKRMTYVEMTLTAIATATAMTITMIAVCVWYLGWITWIGEGTLRTGNLGGSVLQQRTLNIKVSDSVNTNIIVHEVKEMTPVILFQKPKDISYILAKH